MYKKFLVLLLGLLLFVSLASQSFAQVVVRPDTALIAQTVVFSVGVESGKVSPTTGVRLIIPPGVTNVVPNVKHGWIINTINKGENISEIDWTGGTIPQGERIDFTFEATVPGQDATLAWKAYQSYENGQQVSWSQTPGSSPSANISYHPFSETRVINNITDSAPDIDQDYGVRVDFAIFLSATSLVLSALTAYLVFKKRKSGR